MAATKEVHFSEDEDAHGNDIAIKPVSDDLVHVHIGFLQVHHLYIVRFALPESVLSSRHSTSFVDPEIPNLNLHLVSLDSNQVAVELKAVKPKLIKESFTLKVEETGRLLTVVLQARVLGKGKGTPMLKNGVTFLDTIPDPEDSDVNTDWQGF